MSQVTQTEGSGRPPRPRSVFGRYSVHTSTTALKAGEARIEALR